MVADSSMTMSRPSRLHPPLLRPNVELQLDELPLIDDFLEDGYANGVDALEAGDRIVSGELLSIDEYLEVTPELDADGWAVSSWQSYDWQGLAALGSFAEAPEIEEADAEWSTTDWTPVATATRRTPEARAAYASAHSTAAEVAMALDSIARKIRSGELSIDQFRVTPPEAALAAALAAMLKLRR